MDEARALLDQLMGEDRDGVKKQKISDYRDPQLCRLFLCGLCPHDLFTNTKHDLRACPKVHSTAMAEKYQKAKDAGTEPGFEEELYHELRRLRDQCDQRVARAQRRLEDTQGPGFNPAEDPTCKMISDLIDQAEEQGMLGNVDGALDLVQQADALKRTRLRGADQDKPGLHRQKLRVCETCASLLSLWDTERRLQDHYAGKLHLGYSLIRRRVEQLELQKHAWATRRRGPGDQHRQGHAPPAPATAAAAVAADRGGGRAPGRHDRHDRQPSADRHFRRGYRDASHHHRHSRSRDRSPRPSSYSRRHRYD